MTYRAFGDSITTGAGASTPSTKGYIALLNAALQSTFDNAAVSTAMAIDSTTALFQRNAVAGDISIVGFGTNDQAKYGVDSNKQSWFIDAIRSYALWLGAVCKIANAANGVTFTGSWGNGYALGIYGASAAGSKATFASSGDSLAIGYLKQYNNAGTFTVKVDGVLKGTYAIGGDVRTLLGAGWGTSSLLITGLGAGAHSVEIEVTYANSSNPVYFHWFSSCTPKAKVIINNIPHAIAYTYGGSNANVDSYNASLNALVSSLQAIGIDVLLADICAVLSSSDFADNVHPNDAGHVKIKNADLALTNGVVTPPQTTYTQTNIYRGSDGFFYAGELGNLTKLSA